MTVHVWSNRLSEQQIPDTTIRVMRLTKGREWYEMLPNKFDWTRMPHWAELQIEEHYQNANNGS